MLFGGDRSDGMDIDREEILLETRREILGSEQTQKNKTESPWLSSEHSLMIDMPDGG